MSLLECADTVVGDLSTFQLCLVYAGSGQLGTVDTPLKNNIACNMLDNSLAVQRSRLHTLSDGPGSTIEKT